MRRMLACFRESVWFDPSEFSRYRVEEFREFGTPSLAISGNEGGHRNGEPMFTPRYLLHRPMV